GCRARPSRTKRNGRRPRRRPRATRTATPASARPRAGTCRSRPARATAARGACARAARAACARCRSAKDRSLQTELCEIFFENCLNFLDAAAAVDANDARWIRRRPQPVAFAYPGEEGEILALEAVALARTRPALRGHLRIHVEPVRARGLQMPVHPGLEPG